MQLSKAVLTALLLNLATSTPANPSNDENFTPESLAPHIARELVDKSPVIQVNTIDKVNSLPISHIERHISSDSCPDLLKFTQRNGNPILLLSKLNDTFVNWENQPDDISISITHPSFHGHGIFIKPTVSLFGTLQKLENLSPEDVSNLKQCFKRLHRANDEWLSEVDVSGDDDAVEQDLFFAEFDVNEVKFVGDFGYGEFDGVIDGETYHGAVPAHEVPPCPWHLPPHDDNDEEDEKKPHKGHSKKHHGNKKGRKHGNSSKKHHGNKNSKEHEDDDMKHHENEKSEEHEESSKKQRGNKKGEQHGMKHHGNKNSEEHEESSKKQHGNKKVEEHDVKHNDNKMDIDHQQSDDFGEDQKNNEKSRHDKEDDDRSVAVVPNSQTIFEILKIWFNNY